MKIHVKKLLQLLCVVLKAMDFCETVQTRTNTRIGTHSSLLKRPLFTIVRFLHIPCSSYDGHLSGTCFSLTDCLRMQGSQIGTCASGFGVCCVFLRSCGSTVSQNRTHFTNPGFPHEISDTEDSMCKLTLLRPHAVHLCQIRLDFLDFDLARPTEGQCLGDRFIVTGGQLNAPVPEICGQNAGQHMYIDVENAVGPIHLTVNSKGAGERKWNIKMTYIECNNPSKAPPNCLQYYMEPEGHISSFNYESGEEAVLAGGYLNNQNYAICFRKEANSCSITYTGNNIESFSILNVDPETSAPTVGAGEAGLGIDECPMDYLRLGGDRYCGARLNPSTAQPNPDFNAPVTDNTTGPFIVYFKTDSSFNAAGFNLKFKQNECG